MTTHDVHRAQPAPQFAATESLSAPKVSVKQAEQQASSPVGTTAFGGTKTNPQTESQQGVASNASITGVSVGGQASDAGTRKRLLKALACPPALVIISVCHAVLAVTYWAAFCTTGNGLYLPVAGCYSAVAIVSLYKVRETYKKSDIPSRKMQVMKPSPTDIKHPTLTGGAS